MHLIVCASICEAIVLSAIVIPSVYTLWVHSKVVKLEGRVRSLEEKVERLRTKCRPIHSVYKEEPESESLIEAEGGEDQSTQVPDLSCHCVCREKITPGPTHTPEKVVKATTDISRRLLREQDGQS